MDRILVPLDGSKLAESAIGAAAALVRRDGGILLLLHAVAPSQWFSAPAAGFVALERARAVTYLAGVAGRLRRRGVKVESRVLGGEPSRLVVSLAHKEEVDLVAISGRGRGGAGGALGSVAERILRTSPVPVLLIRGGARPVRRILVPLDGSAESLGVMVAVGQSARPLGANVALLHVGKRRGRILARAMDVLARLGIPGRICVRPGRAAQTIGEVAAELDADVVAMSAAPATGDRRLYLGGVVEELLRRSDRSLLVVRRPARVMKQTV
jgi:nucleotide-binding universal stress UspA family protein